MNSKYLILPFFRSQDIKNFEKISAHKGRRGYFRRDFDVLRTSVPVHENRLNTRPLSRFDIAFFIANHPAYIGMEMKFLQAFQNKFRRRFPIFARFFRRPECKAGFCEQIPPETDQIQHALIAGIHLLERAKTASNAALIRKQKKQPTVFFEFRQTLTYARQQTHLIRIGQIV